MDWMLQNLGLLSCSLFYVIFLQNISVEVREQGACALWSLAGHTKTQEKYIAEITGITHIHQMLLEPTEKLLTVGKIKD